MSYYDELTKAMTMLGEQENSLFIGQSVKYGGQAMKRSLANVPENKLMEFPVAENMQMGFCTGLTMQGYLPLSIYPRIDFLMFALPQLVLELDKMDNPPKVIIRTSVGAKRPMNAGPQHTNDFVLPFANMLEKVHVRAIWKAEEVMPLYKWAMVTDGPVMLVEYTEKYSG